MIDLQAVAEMLTYHSLLPPYLHRAIVLSLDVSDGRLLELMPKPNADQKRSDVVLMVTLHVLDGRIMEGHNF